MKTIAVANKTDELMALLKPLRRSVEVRPLAGLPSDPADLAGVDLVVLHVASDYSDDLKAAMGRLSKRSIPFVVHSDVETLKSAALALKHGATDYFPRSAGQQAVLSCLERLLAEHEIYPLPETEDGDHLIVGSSAPMREVFKLIGKIAASHVSVLLRGESGTGKELVARQIHMNSARRAGPFVVIDCAAIPRELLENELFGHEKGAYSGAEERGSGKFDLAHGGTVFLDEIAELGLDLQSKILRVLQEGEFYRIGGQRPVRVDVRVIVATNRDLEGMVRNGQFREDLYHRLNVIKLSLPPLRERIEDLPLLLSYFMRRFAREFNLPPRRVSVEVIKRLSEHDWPGNIRELENKVRRLLLTDRAPVVTAAHAVEVLRRASDQPRSETDLASLIREGFLEDAASWKRKSVYNDAVARVERALIKAVLLETRGNQVSAARILGISRNTLRIKMAELLIDGETFRDV